MFCSIFHFCPSIRCETGVENDLSRCQWQSRSNLQCNLNKDVIGIQCQAPEIALCNGNSTPFRDKCYEVRFKMIKSITTHFVLHLKSRKTLWGKNQQNFNFQSRCTFQRGSRLRQHLRISGAAELLVKWHHSASASAMPRLALCLQFWSKLFLQFHSSFIRLQTTAKM